MNSQQSVPHPGVVLRSQLKTLGIELEVGEVARQLGVVRSTYSRLLNTRTSLTPDMAARLVAWIGHLTGDTVLTWLQRQAEYDAWEASQAVDVTSQVEKFHPVEPPPKQGALFLARAA